MKNQNTAGLLALLLGGIGVHKFYLNKPIQGLLYAALCWTFVPVAIALIEAIVIFGMKPEKFNAKYNAGFQLAQPVQVHVAAVAAPQPDRVDRLEALHRLKTSGGLTDAEYENEKRRLLGPA